MNISTIFNSSYLNKVNDNKQLQKFDTVPSTTKTQSTPKTDAISSATKTTGGDHYFEAKV